MSDKIPRSFQDLIPLLSRPVLSELYPSHCCTVRDVFGRQPLVMRTAPSGVVQLVCPECGWATSDQVPSFEEVRALCRRVHGKACHWAKREIDVSSLNYPYGVPFRHGPAYSFVDLVGPTVERIYYGLAQWNEYGAIAHRAVFQFLILYRSHADRVRRYEKTARSDRHDPL